MLPLQIVGVSVVGVMSYPVIVAVAFVAVALAGNFVPA
jgi:hypothetical protein